MRKRAATYSRMPSSGARGMQADVERTRLTCAAPARARPGRPRHAPPRAVPGCRLERIAATGSTRVPFLHPILPPCVQPSRMAEAGDDPENMAKAQALFNQLQAMKDEAQAIAQKISELDQERHEHSLVAETLEKIDGERKCFRCGCATLRALRCGRIERPVCVLTI